MKDNLYNLILGFLNKKKQRKAYKIVDMEIKNGWIFIQYEEESKGSLYPQSLGYEIQEFINYLSEI